MKFLVGFSRIFVGVLFIISGLIKLNDPLGFSFKLEEYFSQGVLDLPFLMPYALAISIFVVIVEVLLGVMLLVGFKPKLTVWSLLAMIVFFTFLTFYSAYYNKVTDCGCFGDAIKLTPWESFIKDVLLLVLITILVIGVKHIKPFLPNRINTLLIAFSLLGCTLFCYYVLNHLPLVDFRPYKIGANIQEGMTIPHNAPKPIYEYAWKFNVGGEEKVIVTNGEYPSVEGEFIGVETTEIQKGYEPPIHDFTLEKEGVDQAADLLAAENLMMVIAYDLAKSNLEAFEEIKKVSDEALQKGYTVIGASASNDDLKNQLIERYDLNFDFYFTDETALKTIVRSNPGVLLLNKGTIIQKVHYNDLDDLVLQESQGRVSLHIQLKKELDSIMAMDQKYRIDLTPENLKKQAAIDSSNLEYIEAVIAEHGYPGKSLVGYRTGEVAWYVLQHSNKIGQYINVIKEAAENKELGFSKYAMMLDRYLVSQNKPQIYGTQGSTLADGHNFIWPIKNLDSANILRKNIFGNTVEEYSKQLFGEDFEFKYYTIQEIDNLRKSTSKL
ncbi:BT_3928 family protein [Flagellimonas lutaonensis]|uniref:DoxX family protein n=1 Tax=Flagellimonas lutaonensis TaxID=516051 RepID=A0A0D5YQZ2_9FLAO|nr:BT_3928 family protein [Allomuricauda lutaonensis]AKA34308.1 DoxX family protein [Allomuricauda lutaonensis]